VAYEDRLSRTAACPDHIIQILHMRRDCQGLVTAAPLMGLKHMPPFTHSAGERRQLARCGGPAVHRDHGLDSDPVLPNDKTAHRIFVVVWLTPGFSRGSSGSHH
jgi:hypothetical protein